MGSIADIDQETANATRVFIEKVASQYDLAGAVLFGSRARKSHRADSAADVAVLLRGRPGKFVATKLAMADLAYDVLLETGSRICQGTPRRRGCSCSKDASVLSSYMTVIQLWSPDADFC